MNAPRTVVDTYGRKVGVYEYGDPAGRPVLAFHGIPSCGAGFTWTHTPAQERGLRVIAPDRPGIGRSTRVKGYTVADYPAMVASLGDALGLERFGAFGYSGGGPYAVATAAALPDRVTGAAVAAGMGQVGDWAKVEDFEATDQQFMKMCEKRPQLAFVLLTVVGKASRLNPSIAYKEMLKQLNESDRATGKALGSSREAMALFTEAFSGSAWGVVDDYRATGGAWGIDLGAITTPMRIFHGTDDTMVPAHHSAELAKRVPNAELVEWPGLGHLGPIAHVDEILAWLASTAESA